MTFPNQLDKLPVSPGALSIFKKLVIFTSGSIEDKSFSEKNELIFSLVLYFERNSSSPTNPY
jgi:hypothetical protein